MDSTNMLLCWCKGLYFSEKSEMHQNEKILLLFKIWSHHILKLPSVKQD